MQRGSELNIYNVFNKPTQLGNTQFVYGASQQKVKQVTGTKTTYFIGGLYELENNNGTITETSYAGAYTQKKSASTLTYQYSLYDHLGSTDVITNELGAEQSRMAFDPFGSKLQSHFSSYPSTSANTSNYLGYTGHSMVENLGLIHMGGRVYDPLAGRFLSADLFVQEPNSTQSYNRYSYVGNNPLSATDPSGYRGVSREYTAVKHPQYITETRVTGYGPGIYTGQAAQHYLSGLSSSAFTSGAAMSADKGFIIGQNDYNVQWNRWVGQLITSYNNGNVAAGNTLRGLAKSTADAKSEADRVNGEGLGLGLGGCGVPMVCAAGDALQGTEFGVGTALGGASATASALRYASSASDLEAGVRSASRVVHDVHPAYQQQINATKNAVGRLNGISKALGIAGAIPSVAMYGVNITQGHYNAAAINATDLLMSGVAFFPPYGTAASVVYFSGRFAVDYNTR
ncbi:MAG: RHS repeat-associated core domain-containing protein [Marinagarivorans sp.]|nr:RHS repeat-associated core domain-containing protein [Marinagarivorans sp.]